MRTDRLEWLDLLRGLAAIAVAAYHFKAFLGARHVEHAFVAVDMFFALSGVVLTLKYRAAILQGMSTLEFAGARLRRLYPMIAITGMFIAAMNLASVPAGVHMGADDRDAWTVLLVYPSPGVDFGAAWLADPPLWSFWAELAANAVWFVALRTGRRGVPVVGAVAMAITVACAWRLQTLNIGWEPGFGFRLVSLARALAWFCVGSAIALHPMRIPTTLLIAAGAVTSWALASRWHAPISLAQILAATAAVAFVNVACRLPAPAQPLSTCAWALGLISFPLYLLHAPAGRLLAYFGSLPHAVAFVLVVGTITVLATVANEAAIRFATALHRGHARRMATPLA